MLDIAYLALMVACVACCVTVIDRLARSEAPLPTIDHNSAAAISETQPPETRR